MLGSGVPMLPTSIYGVCAMKNDYINIKEIAQAKGLKSTRSLRIEINKPESKYISREVKVNGGTSYEILFSSLEPEIQQKLRECETKSTELVPLNYQPPVVTDKARLTANHRMNIIKAACKRQNGMSYGYHWEFVNDELNNFEAQFNERITDDN